jgi:hypothetical protein
MLNEESSYPVDWLRIAERDLDRIEDSRVGGEGERGYP